MILSHYGLERQKRVTFHPPADLRTPEEIKAEIAKRLYDEGLAMQRRADLGAKTRGGEDIKPGGDWFWGQDYVIDADYLDTNAYQEVPDSLQSRLPLLP